MREMVFGMLAASGVGVGVYFWPAGDVPGNLYPLSSAEAVSRLASAPTRTGTPPFYNMELTAAVTGNDRVDYMNSDGRVLCKVYILPAEGGVNVSPTCSDETAPDLGIEPGAISRTTTKLQDDAFAEFVDSALDGRPFNKAAVNARTVGTVMNNMGAMQREALETQREFQQMEADLEADAYYNDSAGGGYGPEAVEGGYADETVDESYYR
jgi:hypothetical protein